MMGPLARIIVRYGAGALVGVGFMSPSMADQMATDTDLVQAVTYGLGFVAFVAVEGYYWLAKRRGWNT